MFLRIAYNMGAQEEAIVNCFLMQTSFFILMGVHTIM